MNTIAFATFGLGIFTFLSGLITTVLAVIISCDKLGPVGITIGMAGLFFIGFGIFLKLAALLFGIGMRPESRHDGR